MKHPNQSEILSNIGRLFSIFAVRIPNILAKIASTESQFWITSLSGQRPGVKETFLNYVNEPNEKFI